jgi:hypothetical protein
MLCLSFLKDKKCRARLLIFSVSTAICTPVEPRSVSWILYLEMASLIFTLSSPFLLATDTLMVRAAAEFNTLLMSTPLTTGRSSNALVLVLAEKKRTS